MDRRGRRARALTAGGAAFLFAAAAGSDAPRIPIREARWVVPAARFEALSREPDECLVRPRDAAARRSVEIGRLAFRAPLLLGGQAARAGLSCAACHRNGRDNPHFLFPGLSGAPGTADVTSSLMSSHRGDRLDNPKRIPDLAGPVERQKIARDRESRALDGFIRGLIVEEFDGPEPEPAVLAALSDYVRALRPEACRATARNITLSSRLDRVEEAVRLATRSPAGTAAFLVAAARSALGAVDERFQLAGLDSDRALLRKAGSELREARSGSGSLASWLAKWPDRRRRLLADEPLSLYSRRRLRAALRD